MSFCKVYTAAFLAGALALGGCASGTSVSTTTPNVAAVTTQVVQGVETACSYAPAAVDVAKLVSASVGKGESAVSLAGEIVNEICGQVNKKSARRGDSASTSVVVDGIVIHGSRI